MLTENESIEIVAEDLRFLLEEWDEQVDDHSLRRSSVFLRRLLVDNELQRAWKLAGFEKEPAIRASSLKTILTQVPKEKIVFVSASGARYQGAELRSALLASYAMTQHEISQNYAAGLPEETLGPRGFIEALCIIAEQRLIPRRVLIKYVSNKLGGAHHDPKRGKTEDDSMFRLLDRATRESKLLVSRPFTSSSYPPGKPWSRPTM